jgi:hypothetical protein
MKKHFNEKHRSIPTCNYDSYRNHTKGIVSSGLPVVFRVYFSRQISKGATDSASIGNNAIDQQKKNLMNCVTDGRKYRTGNIFIRFRFLLLCAGAACDGKSCDSSRRSSRRRVGVAENAIRVDGAIKNGIVFNPPAHPSPGL